MKHVLVVDDDPDIRMTVSAFLEDEGYLVAAAADGLEAVAVLRANKRHHVVLLDIDMPRMTGTDVLAAARTDPTLAIHTYVIMTARDKTLTMTLAQLMSAMQLRLLAKPFDLDHLLRVVKDADKR
jgi:CheY-like chemotaxis protein